MTEGEPPVGRGRSAAAGNRGVSHMDRGHSPRPIPNGDVHTERDRDRSAPERSGGGGGGRGNRGDHYSGGGGGNRFRGRGDDDQSKKIPRLTKNRRSNGGASGDSNDRGQMAPVSLLILSEHCLCANYMYNNIVQLYWLSCVKAFSCGG